MGPIVWVSDSSSQVLRQALHDAVVVTSLEDFLAAKRDRTTTSFIDRRAFARIDEFTAKLATRGPDARPQLDRLTAALSTGPTIAICDAPLANGLGWLSSHSWLSHVVSNELFAQDLAARHIANIVEFARAPDPRLLRWLQPMVAGRRVRFTQANRCAQRLERMRHFFTSQHVPLDVVERLCEASEVLLANAFYAAPVAAGASGPIPIQRNVNVEFPDDLPCDIAYGRLDDLAMVRVRDPFGALSRDRVVEALSGTTPGGLARVLSLVSIFAVCVVDREMTEVFIAMPISSDPSPLAVHFFRQQSAGRGAWKVSEDGLGSALMDESVTVSRIPD